MKRLLTVVCAATASLWATTCLADPDPNTSRCNGFFGASCGVITGANFNLGSNKVASASVVNGVVRVDKDQNITLNTMFEVHHFLWSNSKVATGIFAAVGTDTGSTTLTSYAFGGIIGFPKDNSNVSPFDIVIGIALTPNTQVLGDGVFANKPLPAGETAVRFKDTTAVGALFAVGLNF